MRREAKREDAIMKGICIGCSKSVAVSFGPSAPGLGTVCPVPAVLGALIVEAGPPPVSPPSRR
jgi:hypothetical protein